MGNQRFFFISTISSNSFLIHAKGKVQTFFLQCSMIKKEQVNYAFIDSQNLNMGVKSLGWSLDFKKFRIFLKDVYSVKEAYLFIGHILGNERLYTDLQKHGYILIFKPTLMFKSYYNMKVKGNVDAELVLHAMIEWKNYEKAIIVSGDGDFHCLIEYLGKKKKLLKIIVPNKRYSSLLRKFGKYIVKVEAFKEKVKK
jgi:uncharacterized LabA/DUF88 family protein